jgi:hypothetical protein
MKRKTISNGALYGPVLRALKDAGRPVLCVFKDEDRQYKPPGSAVPYEDPYWYPSVVLPDDDEMPAHVFNVSE